MRASYNGRTIAPADHIRPTAQEILCELLGVAEYTHYTNGGIVDPLDWAELVEMARAYTQYDEPRSCPVCEEPCRNCGEGKCDAS